MARLAKRGRDLTKGGLVFILAYRCCLKENDVKGKTEHSRVSKDRERIDGADPSTCFNFVHEKGEGMGRKLKAIHRLK